MVAIWPVQSAESTSQLSRGYTYKADGTGHTALDIYFKGIEGTPVCSPVDGIVTSISTCTVHHSNTDCKSCNGSGTSVTIKDKRNSMKFWMCHLQANSLKVKIGDCVSQGQVLAKVGNTGFSSGAHLHFVVKNTSGKNVDPNAYYVFRLSNEEITRFDSSKTATTNKFVVLKKNCPIFLGPIDLGDSNTAKHLYANNVLSVSYQGRNCYKTTLWDEIKGTNTYIYDGNVMPLILTSPTIKVESHEYGKIKYTITAGKTNAGISGFEIKVISKDGKTTVLKVKNVNGSVGPFVRGTAKVYVRAYISTVNGDIAFSEWSAYKAVAVK